MAGWFDKVNLLDDTGGNGKVYKGRLDDGTEVAVKRPIEYNGYNNPIQHMIHEIEIHKKVEHPRIVQLMGYCRNPQPFLVYKYMSRGNLFNHLHRHSDPKHVARGVTFLTWPKRLNIADQISEALVYLHNHHRIIHVDVKSANILFDDNFNAKLSDFGHSQVIEQGKSHISMPAEGTPHLRDPYWEESGKLTDKTDVFCFGKLLEELLTSKEVAKRKRGKDVLVKKRTLMEEVDPKLWEGMNWLVQEQMKEIWSLAIKCMSHQIEHRPSMEKIQEQIKRIMNLDR